MNAAKAAWQKTMAGSKSEAALRHYGAAQSSANTLRPVGGDDLFNNVPV